MKKYVIWPWSPLEGRLELSERDGDVLFRNTEAECPICGGNLLRHKFHSLRSSPEEWHFACPEPPTPVEQLAEIELEEG